MSAPARVAGLLVAVLVCCGLFAAPAAASGDVLVVDDDGDADYATIAAAVGNASDGDTVRVRPGTYDGGVRLADNVTVVAPRGATIEGPGIHAGDPEVDAAFRIVHGSHAAPVVTGFTVSGYFDGVAAGNTAGDWVVRDTTFHAPMGNAVTAMASEGDWRLENVTVRNVSEAVVAIRSAGDWVVADSRLNGSQRPIQASSASGDWTVQNVTITSEAGVEADDDRVLFLGVDARNASGDWTVADATVENGIDGVDAAETSGNWTVVDTRFHDISTSERFDFLMPPLPEGTGVYAADASGSWAVRGSSFVDVDAAGVDATDGATRGTVAGNEFEAVATDCVGAVDCAGGTDSSPPDSPAPTGTTTPVQSSTPTPHTDPGSVTPSSDGTTTPTAGDGTLAPWLALAALLLGGCLGSRWAAAD